MKTLPFVALLWALPAFATTLISLDVPTMSRASAAIVQGKVTKLEPKASKDGRRINTLTYVEVTEVLKGDAVATVVVTQPGGELGDVGQKVSGTAHFAVGDEVVVFLERHGLERYQLVGMAQGKFKVERSTDGKAAYALPDPEAEMLLLDATTHQPVARNAAPLSLDTLKAQIHQALAPAVANEPPPPAQIDAAPRAPVAKPPGKAVVK